MATQAIRLRAEPLRSIAFGSIQASFEPIGNPLLFPARIIHIQNLTDQTIIWSMDGTNDHGILASGAFILLDITANKSLEQGEYIAVGTQFYVLYSSVAPTINGVYMSVFYGSTN